MPRGRKKKTDFKSPTINIALLLVKFTLIKIGSIPMSILKSVVHAVYLTARAITTLTLSTQKVTARRKKPKKAVARLWQCSSTNIANFFSKLQLSFKRKFQRRPGRPKKLRLSKKTKIVVALSSFVIFLFAYTVFILTAAYELPSPNKLISSGDPLTTEFYDRNGKLLYRLYEGRNRTLVNLSETPKYLIQATLATEDENFYHHMGIDFKAIVRAIYHNLQNGSQEGASTITQQLIKNSLLTPERTYTRKIKEAILALWTERVYSKDQILQMYFNEAPYGGAIVGIGAASQTYFGKPPSELNLAESAYLAGLPVSPTQFSPYGPDPSFAKIRQKEVLGKMVKSDYITKTQADTAFAQELDIKPQVNNILAPHFVFYTRDLLVQKYGPRIVSQGGLKVYTTLDLNLQEKVEKIVAEEIDKLQQLDVKNGAAMVLDGSTGQILSMVGSRDYHYPAFGNFNVALSLRQPGSSIKPVTYATAFEKGFNPNSVILDAPVTFRDAWGNAYSPVNYDGTFHGPVTLRQALGSSLNIPAVKLLATVGVDSVVQTARDLGITTFDHPERYGLSLTLGGAEVKMIEMMGVYGALSQNGVFRVPTGILKVADSEGHILEDYKDSSKQAVTPTVAYLITNILSDDNARKMAFGPNSLLNISGYNVAVKTGTSDNKKDNWTFGYTPKLVVGVWVGNPNSSPMNPTLTSGVTGAAPIWNKIIHALVDGTTPLAFDRPPGITEPAAFKSMVSVTKNEDKLIFTDAFSTFATSSAQANQAPPNL